MELGENTATGVRHMLMFSQGESSSATGVTWCRGGYKRSVWCGGMY